MKPPVIPSHVPVTNMPDLVLIYRSHLNSSKVSRRAVFVMKPGIFQSQFTHLRQSFFLENILIIHSIVSFLIFKYLNVFGIEIWESVKPGIPKEVRLKLILAIFDISVLQEKAIAPLCWLWCSWLDLTGANKDKQSQKQYYWCFQVLNLPDLSQELIKKFSTLNLHGQVW